MTPPQRSHCAHRSHALPRKWVRSSSARSAARIVAAPVGFGLMRAVLIVNPTATSTTTAGRDLLANALKSRLDLTVEHTRHRGHGGEIAQAAVQDGVDLVVVHGGDGTVSNVVNGLLGKPGQLPTGHVPALAIVPGGSANVTARSLGISPGPIDATNQLIWLLDKYGREKNVAPDRADRLRRAVGGAERRHGGRCRGGGQSRGPAGEGQKSHADALHHRGDARDGRLTPASNRG